ncbi:MULTISPECIES: LLM class F420-dependent oxidoreductase [Rhodococcus]|jgi:probable F420-dependent oxidoreductase|uniref:LLM class F420-dependent oxidoreductase n=1 Tax=Rhodococcus TaxID=1827 RepID=UPI00045D07CF|nr:MULTISPECIES: LLM class F420-dependent oxidoreductase [Rhodococcus]ANZ27684.1 LLM class F420-dependent oxidoreductase [Rhodococcus sp. WB1]KDE11184.1 F420-dependent oxidoreductase [Rhodococcus aetherivorans]MDV6293052.1 LLM class F420-dependent oxidoreductase [Rhodococcus aetherivorans]NGP25792.1 LLM class F420-dependent oxidoreductase [Rhodococcus aetherivorans]OLL19640.1 LLM class F420-dependent oxidoreductase [Rhodococcus sp. M8]
MKPAATEVGPGVTDSTKAENTTQTPPLGRFGVWRHATGLPPETGAEIEKLGYGTIWIGGSPPADLEVAERLLDATENIVVATGIVNIWTAPADEIAASYHRLEERHPGRFLLGVGVGHPEAHGETYRKPYAALVEYLDVLDREGVPEARRVLAALGPKVLKLSADRAAGAHPYLTTPEHTREARAVLGPGAVLAPEQKIVLSTDVATARTIGRKAVANPYLKLRNYRANLERTGFTAEELDNDGTDRVVDALVAHGDAEYIASRLREHLDAGADHVAVQALPMRDDPVPALREVAAALGL